MRPLDLPKVLIGMLLLTSLVLLGQKGGLWMRAHPAAPLPPTPAFLETQRQQAAAAAEAAAAAAREAARQAEAARLAALQRPEETPEVLPPGEHRDEVFYTCTACHSSQVIRRTRLSRERWDELMDWMVARHRMNPLEPEQRIRIIDYLTEHFPPQRGGARGRNPFLEQ